MQKVLASSLYSFPSSLVTEIQFLAPSKLPHITTSPVARYDHMTKFCSKILLPSMTLNIKECYLKKADLAFNGALLSFKLTSLACNLGIILAGAPAAILDHEAT